MEFKPYKMGKYLLLERLAAGGMAEVYRAKASGASGFEKHLAIKRILPEHLEDETFRKMFETEARIGSSLQHANIVQILDFVKFGETFLLVMEFVNGKNLRQVVNKLKKEGFSLPLECVIFIINETLKGLEYAHTKQDEYTGQSNGIIHRDMSPQNIMISYDGSVKIVDFGIANCKDKIEHTKSGVIKGKFGYMSPEQAAGEALTPLSDLFSLGIILWELLAGKRLFSAESDLATLRLIQDCLIPKPSQFNSKINSELERIVMKSLSKSPHQRFRTAGAMQKQIQEYLNIHYPGFRGTELGSMMQALFQSEILIEKRRLEQVARQSVPFSQGGTNQLEIEENSLEDLGGSSITTSAQDKISHITFVDRNSAASNVIQLNDPDSLTQKASIKSSTLSDTEPGEPAAPPSNQNTLEPIEKTLVAKTEAANLRTSTSTSQSSKESDLNQSLLKTSPFPKKETTEQAGSISLLNDPVELPSTKGSERISLWKGSVTEEPVSDERETWITFTGALKIISALMVLGITGYLYHVLLSGKANPIERITAAPPVDSAKSKQAMKTQPRATSSDLGLAKGDSRFQNCEVTFETDPPGALLIIDGMEKLVTPGIALIPCNTSVNFSLQLPGFETQSEDIRIKPGLKPLFRALRKVETGNIVLVVNRRVRVLSDIKVFGETEPGQAFIIEGLPVKNPVVLRLVNEVFGIDKSISVEVKPNVNTTYRVDLDERK